MNEGDRQGGAESDNPWVRQNKLLGEFIRSQRRLAKLSLRDLAARTAVSNPYLSQIERGLHEPSLRVLKVIAEALDLSADALLAQAGLLSDEPDHPSPADATTTIVAIRTDPTLTDSQKTAMLAIYDSYQEANVATPGESDGRPPPSSPKQPRPRATTPPQRKPRQRPPQ